jgi:hypothetical protein
MNKLLLKCINKQEYQSLTIGKIYIGFEDDEYYSVKNNSGDITKYYKYRFEILNTKLAKILYS